MHVILINYVIISSYNNDKTGKNRHDYSYIVSACMHRVSGTSTVN